MTIIANPENLKFKSDVVALGSDQKIIGYFISRDDVPKHLYANKIVKICNDAEAAQKVIEQIRYDLLNLRKRKISHAAWCAIVDLSNRLEDLYYVWGD